MCIRDSPGGVARTDLSWHRVQGLGHEHGQIHLLGGGIAELAADGPETGQTLGNPLTVVDQTMRGIEQPNYQQVRLGELSTNPLRDLIQCAP